VTVRAEPVEAQIKLLNRSPFDKLRVNGIVLMLVTILFPSVALAVEVEPPRLELAISPTEPTAGGLEIRNPGDKSVEVRVTPGPYRFLQPGLKLPSCQDWLRFEPDRFTLAAGATATVAYSIQPPENLGADAAAEYLAAIQVDQFPAEESVRPEQAVHPSTNAQGERRVEGPTAPKARLTIVPRIALPVYLMIQGREKVDVELAAVEPRVQEGKARLLRLDTTLKNRGTVHARPSGTFALFQGDGQMHRAGPLGKGIPVLPGTSLTLTSYIPLPPPGPYRLVTTLETEGQELLQKETRLEITEEGEVVRQREP